MQGQFILDILRKILYFYLCFLYKKLQIKFYLFVLISTNNFKIWSISHIETSLPAWLCWNALVLTDFNDFAVYGVPMWVFRWLPIGFCNVSWTTENRDSGGLRSGPKRAWVRFQKLSYFRRPSWYFVTLKGRIWTLF